MSMIEVHGLQVDQSLHDLVAQEVLPGTGVDGDTFWRGLAEIVDELTPRTRELLGRRDDLQAIIDTWHREHGAGTPGAIRDMLTAAGYLVADDTPPVVTTRDVDPEIATMAGPQLVVPTDNARYALNAANARWGSLYDALYGTDALGDQPPPGDYDPQRGARVVAWARGLLDQVVPLADRSWADAVALGVRDGGLVVRTDGDRETALEDLDQFAGHRGDASAPDAVLLRNHGLHLEIVVDRDDPIGRDDAAGVADILLESAVTTIADLEDAVAVVDAADKVHIYRNWLGLMTGDLTAEVTKDGRTFTRRLRPDRAHVAPDGTEVVLPGRSLLLVRHVGHHMTTPAVRDRHGDEVFEGMLDAMVTAAAALHDVGAGGSRANSRAGSVYVVKPKMHGPDEVALTVDLLGRVEDVLGMAPTTLKLGIMDEERRTTLNLPACIRAAQDRVVFINTGFLDRTGDEIHTAMEAGPLVRKGDMKATTWIDAYERWNVDVGIAAGLRGRGQIGKGMWAMPELMAAMLEQKGDQPRAGASTAWVPSPTAATLHAVHYHQVDVAAVQERLASRRAATLEELLTVPVADPTEWTAADIDHEVRNNVQGILGYVVRWVDQGVGSSTVPDLEDIGRMEDRATLRISSQHLANWIHHGVIAEEHVVRAMREMAVVVDRQNEGDPNYRPMAPDFDESVAFQAACDLVLTGRVQPNGYTEGVLHARRRERKARDADIGH